MTNWWLIDVYGILGSVIFGRQLLLCTENEEPTGPREFLKSLGFPKNEVGGWNLLQFVATWNQLTCMCSTICLTSGKSQDHFYRHLFHQTVYLFLDLPWPFPFFLSLICLTVLVGMYIYIFTTYIILYILQYSQSFIFFYRISAYPILFDLIL